MQITNTAVALFAAMLMFSNCATVDQGADPIVVNAERITATAVDTFDVFLKYEYEQRATLERLNPAIHKYSNTLRRNGQQWLQSARSLTQAYKYNRTEQNKANLQTAISVLSEAITQVGVYMTQAKSNR